MRLFLLTSLTMVAFAANSLLNRMVLVDPAMGPASFAAIRMGSGALALAALILFRRRGGLGGSVTGALSLATYVLGFSFAYVWLDAGVGALILFGGVQITMFAGALVLKEPVPRARWIGAFVAFAGLAYLLWPGGADAPGLGGSLLMAVAALGWGIYSLAGRRGPDPLAATAGNFVFAAPLAALVWVALPDGVTGQGALLAVLSGAVTSGLGYALWYTVLPALGSGRAAVTQLVVPVIAMVMGMVFLAEAPNLRFALAAALVLGGIALSLRQAAPSREKEPQAGSH